MPLTLYSTRRWRKPNSDKVLHLKTSLDTTHQKIHHLITVSECTKTKPATCLGDYHLYIVLYWNLGSKWSSEKGQNKGLVKQSLRTKLHRLSTSISIYFVKRRLLCFQGILNFSGSWRAQKGCHTIPLEGLSHKRGRPQQIKRSNQLWWDVEPYEGGLSSTATPLKLSSRKLCLFMSLSAKHSALRRASSVRILLSEFKYMI